MLFNTERTDTTDNESKKTERQLRFYKQRDKAYNLLNTSSLYNYIDGLKYNYSLCIRYNINLKKTIDKNVNEVNKPSFDKCIKCGILKEWNNTYWFDKDKAERLQQFILERQNYINGGATASVKCKA